MTGATVIGGPGDVVEALAAATEDPEAFDPEESDDFRRCAWCDYLTRVDCLRRIDVEDEPGPEDDLVVCPGCDPETPKPLPRRWSR